ncbi:hypothetical protein L6248_01480 [Candidatus Parcubacteria bacterium]|nr:hypothetical protein [Candidatus Parcubacteria bacterium]
MPKAEKENISKKNPKPIAQQTAKFKSVKIKIKTKTTKTKLKLFKPAGKPAMNDICTIAKSKIKKKFIVILLYIYV